MVSTNDWANKKLALQRVSYCAEGGTWTHMREPSLRPERSASANSATSAGGVYCIYFHSFVKWNWSSFHTILIIYHCHKGIFGYSPGLLKVNFWDVIRSRSGLPCDRRECRRVLGGDYQGTPAPTWRTEGARHWERWCNRIGRLWESRMIILTILQC